jgi:2,3-bisphosphoglycerate-independent phosphoglycerate mutase
MDGIGLGVNDPSINPFVQADMPNLRALLGGQPLTLQTAPHVGDQATLLALDACLGVDGLPQSATGQAVLLTGVNIPAELGYHYGPKPNPQVASYLNGDTLFARLKRDGKTGALLNAYPPRYFQGIDSGKRLYSAIPMAVTNADMSLFTKEDYFAGDALAADFTGQGWRDFLGFTDAPIHAPHEAGVIMARLAGKYDFSMFEYWASDYAGHKQDMGWAVRQLEIFDRVLAGLLQAWDLSNGLILITSDHGNMEDLSVRRHTNNPVPALVIGNSEARRDFTYAMKDITQITPAIWGIISSGQ